MKVLLFDTTNYFLTPGGKTVHALKLHQELTKLGVHIEFARWWDESQCDCDIIHFLAPDVRNAKLAKQLGKKTVIDLLFDMETSKTEIQKRKTIFMYRLVSLLPIKEKLYWRSFPYFDKFIFKHQYDKDTALRYFPQIDKNKTMIISHAYAPEEMFISDDLNITDMNLPDKYLISCAHISPRKQSVLLARYAKAAKVPVVFMGKGNNDDYFRAFTGEVDHKYVFYPGYVSPAWKDCIARNASGFILLSKGESGCIAVYEAAAYKLPIMLSNLPWAWGYEEPENISFCDFNNSSKAVEQIRKFYETSGKLAGFPFTIHTWQEIARKYRDVYMELMSET